ncbi:MAG: peptide chain release factor N(5)-glutamine methyltransferase, partial [Gemmatimonadetes bacterium]|nr:peptide chain release factor N(5)-glutamine methyltransferase [Gemmatimonadota bacterium]
MSRPIAPDEGGPTRRLPGPSRREVIEGLAVELEAGGVHGARYEAERVLAHVLGLSRTDLLLHTNLVVGPEEAGRIAMVSRRRLSGVPLQHIEGTVAFRDLVLVCDGRALVPRPETEQLVQAVVDWADGTEASGGVRRVVRRDRTSQPPLEVALDIGTGSGAIALSLIQEGVVSRAVAVDVSSPALEQAAQSAAGLGLEEQIEFRKTGGSPWEAVGLEETFDLIVSNPPYVADVLIPGLPAEVRDHDPREALAGGVDGLDVVRRIASGASSHVRAGGGLFLEVGADQGEKVRRLLEKDSCWKTVRVTADLAGRERFVVALA